jgi:hypothetical protein
MMEEVKMANIGWTIASVGTAALVAVVCLVAIRRMLRDKRSGFPLQKESAGSQEFTALGSTLVIVGLFIEDRLIGYSFIGAGILVSVISVIKSRRKEERSSMEVR